MLIQKGWVQTQIDEAWARHFRSSHHIGVGLQSRCHLGGQVARIGFAAFGRTHHAIDLVIAKFRLASGLQ